MNLPRRCVEDVVRNLAEFNFLLGGYLETVEGEIEFQNIADANNFFSVNELIDGIDDSTMGRELANALDRENVANLIANKRPSTRKAISLRLLGFMINSVTRAISPPTWRLRTGQSIRREPLISISLL